MAKKKKSTNDKQSNIGVSKMSEEKKEMDKKEDIIPTFPPEEIEEVKKEEEKPVDKSAKIVDESLKKEEKIVKVIKEKKSSIAKESKKEKIIPLTNLEINVPVELWKNSILSFKGFMKISDIISKMKSSDTLKIIVKSATVAKSIKSNLPEQQKDKVIVRK